MTLEDGRIIIALIILLVPVGLYKRVTDRSYFTVTPFCLKE